MKPLLHVKETHGIFVTDVEFLDRVAEDIHITSADSNRKIEIPGPAADSRACLVSLSADQTLQVWFLFHFYKKIYFFKLIRFV